MNKYPFTLPLPGVTEVTGRHRQLTRRQQRSRCFIHQREERCSHLQTSSQRQRGDPGERAAVSDTVLMRGDKVRLNRSAVAQRIPRERERASR